MKKSVSLALVLLAYLVTAVAVYLIYPMVKDYHPIMAVAILDIIATFIVFGFSLLVNNSSMYDPYWSVAPIPIVLFWVFIPQAQGADIYRQWLIFSLVFLWGFRLTFNWVRRWQGMKDEDWRYAGFRRQFPQLYWLVSLFGIHLFPTLIVLAGCISLYPALTFIQSPFDILDIIAAAITLSAIYIEYKSDEQLVGFLRSGPVKGTFLTSGLWKFSRHPNYFGEVMFWTGVFLFSARIPYFQWWFLAGPVAIWVLFLFISVPMMDKRMLERKEGYEGYMKSTSGLVPWPPKKS
jgi:steroid 5-alpha reductase family enzyme